MHASGKSGYLYPHLAVETLSWTTWRIGEGHVLIVAPMNPPHSGYNQVGPVVDVKVRENVEGSRIRLEGTVFVCLH